MLGKGTLAGDWIKMRLNLVTHPKVMRIAESLIECQEYRDWSGLHWAIPSVNGEKQERYDALRVTRYVTVGALLRYWGYVNEHVEDDETIHGLWPDDIDQIAGIPGFCDALQAVGWLELNEIAGTVKCPNFSKYNTLGPNRGLSMTNAERQKAYRERHKERNVTRNGSVRNGSNAREDKRREDKKTNTEEVVVLPDWLPKDAWKAFLEVRRQKKAPNTPRALKLALTELTRLKSLGHDPAAVLDQSTVKGWKFVFPLSQSGTTQEPASNLCDYCERGSVGTTNGRRHCSLHSDNAMDNEKPQKPVLVQAKAVAG